MISNQQ